MTRQYNCLAFSIDDFVFVFDNILLFRPHWLCAEVVIHRVRGYACAMAPFFSNFCFNGKVLDLFVGVLNVVSGYFYMISLLAPTGAT